MKRLLLLTYFFPPSAAVASHRLLGFVRNLPKLGWQPTVIAPPHVPGEPQDARLSSQIPASVEVVRVPFPQGRIARLADRFFGYGVWLPPVWRPTVTAIRDRRPDAILTSSPPAAVHLLGLALKLRFRLPWVVDLRDPWMTNQPFPPADFLERLQVHGERIVFQHADGIIANTPMAREGYRQTFPQYSDKITSITNGFDPDRFPDAKRQRPDSSLVTILHAGELYSGRDPRPFLDAVQQIVESGDRRFRLQFLGRSTQGLFDLETEVQRRGLSSMTQLGGQVPYDQALRSMTEANILLLVQSRAMGVGVPAKLYEYLGAGRPILALGDPDGDVAWVLRQSGVPYRIAPPKDPVLIRQALLELASEPSAEIGQPPACFTREHLTAELADFLNQRLRLTLDEAKVTRQSAEVPCG